MTRWSLRPLDRPDVPPLAITERLRGQLVYFVAPFAPLGLERGGDDEYAFDPEQVATWLDDGVFYLISPLDTANQTECELSEEQERLVEWLHAHQVRHVRLVPR